MFGDPLDDALQAMDEMPDRRTSNQDLRRLRALADAGIVRAVAAREVGMNIATVRYWDLKEHLGFATRMPAVARCAPLEPYAPRPRLRVKPRYD